MEDGIFKSDYIRIGKGCTIGANSLVNYGVTMSENSIVDTDSFVMKGEAPGPKSIWRGNPARQI
jgi:acetyltransferase-like isoleucine patch superfamily enzyme